MEEFIVPNHDSSTTVLVSWSEVLVWTPFQVDELGNLGLPTRIKLNVLVDGMHLQDHLHYQSETGTVPVCKCAGDVGQEEQIITVFKASLLL